MKEQSDVSRPWLDDNGALHTDVRLREISAKWDADTWEQFLKETVEGSSSYQREELISKHSYNRALDEMTESIWDYGPSTSDQGLCETVKRYCRDHLTPRQQHVVRLTFWEGLSERAIGEHLGVSRSTVMTQKRRALSKLKDLLAQRESIFPLGERATQANRPQERSRDEQIREVYQQEIRNFYGSFGGRR